MIKSNYLYYLNKKECIDTILLLKTAFSLIDDMFQQEIKNAELKNIDLDFNSTYNIFCVNN